eukprot:g5224.t1
MTRTISTLLAKVIIIAAAFLRGAAGDESEKCTAKNDIVLVIDHSSSIAGAYEDQQDFAFRFAEMAIDQHDAHIGVVAFSDEAFAFQNFTSSKRDVLNAVGRGLMRGNTNHVAAFRVAHTMIKDHGREGVKPIIVLITDGVTTECEAADSTCCGYLTPPPIQLRSIAAEQGLTGKVSCKLGEPGVLTPGAERDCNRLLILWNNARSQCEYRRLANAGASVVTVSVNSGAMTNSDITEKESLILLQRLTTPPKERNFISIPDVANMADSVITNLLQKTCKEDCIMDKRWSICEANS